MSIFETVQNLKADYDATVCGFNAARQAAKEITAMAKERIENERHNDADRIAALEGRISAADTTETARSMYRAELERIRAKTYGATDTERAAFKTEFERAGAAVGDLYAIRCELQEAISTAKEEISRIRQETIGDKADTELRSRWIESDRDEFNRLGG